VASVRPSAVGIVTLLCGWSKAGTHFNMGDGPSPESEALLERVLGMDSEAAS
jgi:hypothetical protein